MNDYVLSKKSFKESLKSTESLERIELINIQRQLEEGGITLKLAQELTKHLNKEQKKKLLELYKNQIRDLEDSIENYKRKIIEIRKKVDF